MGKRFAVAIVLLLGSCGGAQVRPTVEPEVSDSCGSYDRQCDECLSTLRAQGNRIGVPIADRQSCPACVALDGVCKGSTSKSLKAWPGPPAVNEEAPEATKSDAEATESDAEAP
jgi:hypothetical protein